MPLILRPTRVSATSATLLDHIWINDILDVDETGIIMSNISDHYPVFSKHNLESNNNMDVYVEVKRRMCGRRNIDRLAEAIAEFDWSLILNISHVESAYDFFAQNFKKLYDQHCPVKIVRNKVLDVKKPYISSEIKQLIKEKHKMQRLYNRFPLTYGERYKSLRNRVNSVIKTAKSRYYKEQFDSNKGDSRQSWKVINDALGRNSKCSKNSDRLLVGDSIVTDPKEIADCFNSYFSNMGKNLASKFVESNEFLTYLPRNIKSKFKFKLCTESEIREIIMNLRNAAHCHDSIPMSLFKENINTLIKIITHICNLSLSSGVFPSDLMLAIVACIYKAGNPELESNYRPISVLPAFSKILEKIVCNQLVNYFTRNNLLTSSQYGFLPGLSTVDAMYSIVYTMLSIGERLR